MKLPSSTFRGMLRLRLEEHSQLMSIAAQVFRFEQLGDSFMEPGRTAAGGDLIDERVSEFVLQDPG